MRNCSRGFTLIELILSTAILLFLTGAFYTLAVFLYQDYEAQVAQAKMQQEVRVALSLFSNESQITGLDPTGRAFYPKKKTKGRVPVRGELKCAKEAKWAQPILEASETVFHLMGDKNGTGRFDLDEGKEKDAGEDIRYEWVGKAGVDSCGDKRDPDVLYRDTGGGMQEVAVGINAFLLTYYDENGEKLPAGALKESERRKIKKVTLILRADTKEGEREFSSEIVLKNRG